MTLKSFLRLGCVFCLTTAIAVVTPSRSTADNAMESESSWRALESEEMVIMLQGALQEHGTAAAQIDELSLRFQEQLDQHSSDPLDAFMGAVAGMSESLGQLYEMASNDPTAAAASLDPAAAGYGEIESLPAPIRTTVRTWLGRSLVRLRLYDEALPVIAEVDPAQSVDPASALFYRGACYHALLMKKEALEDLRTLLENEDECPNRFARVANMMIADIKPLKEDSLDEISRLMTDVSRRLDLGRSGEKVEEQEQKIIDKLTKLIDKLEEQQQQQQQNQGQGGGGGDGKAKAGQSVPMDDSRIAGGQGDGNVKKRNLDDDEWGNVPPAERKEAVQKISRDLPTHYRDAIEAYFRKRATAENR